MSGSVNKKRVQSSLAWGQRSPSPVLMGARGSEKGALCSCSDCWLLLSINRRCSSPQSLPHELGRPSLNLTSPGKLSVRVSSEVLLTSGQLETHTHIHTYTHTPTVPR